jgi:hypothetical protein
MQTGAQRGRRTTLGGAQRSAIAVFALAVALTLTAVALAAKPKHGAHFTGRTSVPPVVGFHAPVSFTVSHNGRSLSNFRFGSFGCFGAGGFRPGVDPYTGGSIIKVAGTVKVSANGHLSVSGAKASYTAFGSTTVTTLSIRGRFSTPKSASGSITFSQNVTGKFTSSCGPATIGFLASTR